MIRNFIVDFKAPKQVLYLSFLDSTFMKLAMHFDRQLPNLVTHVLMVHNRIYFEKFFRTEPCLDDW
jgi:hypothetical protein